MALQFHGMRTSESCMYMSKADFIDSYRATVRAVMHANDPGGADIRFPGGRNKIQRSPLRGFGVFHEVSCDGHEKFASFALRLGDVSIPVYGMRDKWPGEVVHLVAVPNARKAAVIGHVYCDFVQVYGGTYPFHLLYCTSITEICLLFVAIPLQLTVDGGSETGEMAAIHVALRSVFSSSITRLVVNKYSHLQEELHP